MLRRLALVAALLGLGSAALTRRDRSGSNEMQYSVYRHDATRTTIRYVADSGVCETTPGVRQYSGYIDVGENENLWFWFFEARQSHRTAPLALWLNGGPGCSSMLGLFQENGPCTLNGNGSEPQLNPYSWNNYANMLYLDQPVGAGFSYGNGSEADSTPHAAPAVWRFLQAFFDRFPEYSSHEFGLFTESYGGHYGPEFAHYFAERNREIEQQKKKKTKPAPAGSCQGGNKNKKVHRIIKLVALGINNGWIDETIQFRAYIDYAANNTYRPLLGGGTGSNQTKRKAAAAAKPYIDAYKVRCRGSDALARCTANPDNRQACSDSYSACANAVQDPLERLQDFNVYDIRAPRNETDTFPSDDRLYAYLNRPDIRQAIGARSDFNACRPSNIGLYDEARSYKNTLKQVIQSNITVLIWAGDADWLCNYIGNYNVLDAIAPKDFRSKKLQPYTVAGKTYGEYKTAGNLSWLRVYNAGHEIPAYQPEVSLAAFISTMSKRPLGST